jgi:broad specificity phosphatase PhoE
VEPPSEWRDERQYQGQDYLVLTDKGRRVARLITGKKESHGRIVKELPEKPEGNPVA